jgi:chaperone BCS1
LASKISIESTNEKLLNAVLLYASRLSAGSRNLHAKIKKGGPKSDGKGEKFRKVAISANKYIELLDFSN